MKVFACSEWWNVHIVHLMTGLAELDDIEFTWTNKQWFRPDFLPLTPKLEATFTEPDIALSNLATGEYDVAIFSDGTSLLYMTPPLRSFATFIAFIDSTDSVTIPEAWLKHSDLYFKAQYPKSGRFFYRSVYPNEYPIPYTKKIRPFPYPPFAPKPTDYSWSGVESDTVFFSGWAWPDDRLEAIKTLVEAKDKVHFVGGLYQREDMPHNKEIPKNCKYKRLDNTEYLKELVKAGICLNLRGNGWLTFRLAEIFKIGGFCISQPLGNVLVPEPKDGEEIVYCDPGFGNLPDLCEEYINKPDERARIGANAKTFYEQHWSPTAIARYCIDTIGSYYV